MTRAARPLVVALALAGVAACTGVPADGVIGPGGTGPRATGPVSGNPQSTIDSALVGRWFRVIILSDFIGPVTSNETTWQFYADGAATKMFVTRDLIFGYYDVHTFAARWTVDRSEIAIAYPPPSGGTLVYPYRIAGDSLFFAGQGYVRLR